MMLFLFVGRRCEVESRDGDAWRRVVWYCSRCFWVQIIGWEEERKRSRNDIAATNQVSREEVAMRRIC